MPDPVVTTKPKPTQGSEQSQESGTSEADRKREELLAEKERREKLAHAEKVRKEGTAAGAFNAGLGAVGVESDIGASDDTDVLDEMLTENGAGRPDLDGSTPVEGSIDIADGWAADVALGKDNQKIAISAPTGLQFPPPDGFSLPLFGLPIPIGGPAPIFLNIDMGLAGGVTLEDVAIALEHQRGSSDVLRQDHYAATGSGGIGANFGIELSVSILVGAPKLANVQAGVKATAGAEAKLAFEVGGSLDVVSTIPAEGGTAKPVSKDGEIYFSVAGSGELAAELAAYLGYEILTFKGEFFSLSIAKATLANLELGARFGVRYTNGKSEFFAEPITEDGGYVNFDWLFGKLWRARKLDKAKGKAVEAQGDALALMDIADRPDMEQYVADLKAGTATLEVASGKMQLLLNEKEDNERSARADTQAIAELERKIVDLEKADADQKRGRWKITNIVKGDLKELKKARKQLTALQKHLLKKQKAATKASEKLEIARAEFIETIDPSALDDRIAAAKQRADQVHAENWDIFTGEVSREMKVFEKEYAKVRDQLAETDAIIVIKQGELERREGVAEWEARKTEVLAEEQRLAGVVNATVGRNEQLKEALDAVSPDDSSGKKKAQKALTAGEKQLRKDIAEWETAQAQRVIVAQRSPLSGISEQLSKLESRRLLLAMKLEKLEADRIEAYLEEGRLLPNVPDVKKKPKKKDE